MSTRRNPAQMTVSENLEAVARLLDRAVAAVALRKQRDELRRPFAEALCLTGKWDFDNPAIIGAAVRRIIGL